MLDAGSSCTGWAGASGEPSKALPAPLVDGHGDASRAAREAPLAEAQRALSGALAEAFAGLHRAQQILDADLCGALAEAGLLGERPGAPSAPPSGPPPAPLLPGEVPAAPCCEAPLLEARCSSSASPAARAGLRAAAAGAASGALEPGRERAPAEEPARAAGGLRLPTSCFPRLQHRDAAEPPASTVPAVERGAVSGYVLSSAEVERHQKRHNYSEEVLGHWGRIVAGLEEMRSSGMSQLHSTWIDAKAFTLFVANPAHDVKRGSERSPHTPGGSLALGRNFEFHRSSQQSSKRPSLHEECEVDGPGQAWEAIRFVLLVVLHPFTKFRILWDLVGMVFCLYDVTMLPAQVFEFPEGYLVIRWYYDWISGSFWSLDILLNFSTGYISTDGLVEMRKDKVASHYIRSWFVPDLIITIFGWFSIFLSISNSGIFRFGKAASRSLRALRLFRMPKINASFNQILSSMNSESLTILGGLVKFLVILILVTHYVACVWYWLADADGHTWKDRFMDSGDSEMYGYFTSMHWALTQFTPASMEVVPVNVNERLFTCIVIIFAMVVFSSFVSSITQAMTLLRSTHARRVEQEQLMRKYFNEFCIPRELAARCKYFLLQHQRMANKRVRESEIPSMLLLPKAIREELRFEAFMPWLRTHPFFEFFMELCPVGMRQICASATDEVSMLPLEELYWHGQSVNRMFFVRVGRVSYCHRDARLLPLEVRAGQWACEETLWSKVSVVEGPFTAASAGCELITVLPAEFHAIAKLHPGPLRFCVGYAEAFIRGFNNASKNVDCEDLLFNIPDTLVSIIRQACGGDDTLDNPLRSLLGGAKRLKTARASFWRMGSTLGASKAQTLWRAGSMKPLARAYTTALTNEEDPVEDAKSSPSRKSRTKVLIPTVSTVDSTNVQPKSRHSWQG